MSEWEFKPSGEAIQAAAGGGGTSSLLELAIERTPLAAPDGKSGSSLERVILADGHTLVVKRIRPADDWLMRATGDTGRLALMWERGLLARVPPIIEHAIVAVEPDADGFLVVMRDVSAALLPDHLVLSRAQSQRILEAAGALYATFWREQADGLCTVGDLYRMLSPAMAERERAGSDVVPKLVGRGWEIFADVVPADVADAVFAILDEPGLLARELVRHETTLIHGDLKLGNIGLLPGRVVLLDWDRLGVAPPAVDFAWYLAINATRIAAPAEQVIDDFRAVLGEHHDERALTLALIGGLVQLGWNKALDATGRDEAVRARERTGLDWWVRTVRESLETWSPR
jgi:aminoglycoside phosphotransferase (APT) family kinase protein